MKKIKKEVFNNVCCVLDTEFGEVITPDENADSYRIELIQEYNTEETEQVFNKDIIFTKLFINKPKKMKQLLTNNEIATLLFLTDYISYKDCILKTGGNYLGNPLGIKELAELLDEKYNTFRRIMYGLRDKQVIGFHKADTNYEHDCITINPFIFCKGYKISNWVIDYYKDTVWAN